VRLARFEAEPAQAARGHAVPDAPTAPGPEGVLEVEGIPPGSDPVPVADEETAATVAQALDRLLEENERPTAAAILWRVLASFEAEKGARRRELALFLDGIEARVFRAGLVEGYRALEHTVSKSMRDEKDEEALALLAVSAARSMYGFLRAGEFARVARLGRELAGLAGPAGQKGLDHLARTDFFDILTADLASESPERSSAAVEAARALAPALRERLVDLVRTSDDYRLRRLAADALSELGEEGGVSVIAHLGPATPDEEYERIVSVVDALPLPAGAAEEEIVGAINHAAVLVRRAAVAVAHRLPGSSALGVIQRAINEGGTLGAVRTLEAIGELRLVEAFPVVRKQLVDSRDAGVVGSGARAIGRMAGSPDADDLRAVRLLEKALERLPGFADREEAEKAALTTLWALGQYSIPEADGIVEKARRYPSQKVANFAAKMLERRAQGT
jgi:hypothetical protein